MTTLGSHLVLSSAFLSESQYDAMALGIIFPFQLGHKEKGQYQVQGVLPTQTGFCSCTIDQNIIRNHLQLRKTKTVTSVFAFFGGDFLIKTCEHHLPSSNMLCLCQYIITYYYPRGDSGVGAPDWHRLKFVSHFKTHLVKGPGVQSTRAEHPAFFAWVASWHPVY